MMMKTRKYESKTKTLNVQHTFLPSSYHLCCQTLLEWECDHVILNIQDCCFIDGNDWDFMSSELPVTSVKTIPLFELADIQKITLRQE